MSSIKLKFRASSCGSKPGHLYYQLIHKRQVKQMTTGYKIFSDEWDRNKGGILFKGSKERERELSKIKENVESGLSEISRLLKFLGPKSDSLTATELVAIIKQTMTRSSLFNYMKLRIESLEKNGRFRTSETYRCALNSLGRFLEGKDIKLYYLTSDFIESYEAYLLNRGLRLNTVSFYMRILRSVYNRAAEEGLVVSQGNPFKRVYTGIEKTRKRALSINLLRKINKVELPKNSLVSFSRDIFILSFLFRGMSFIDMAYLRKKDLRGGMISYLRRKTGKRMTIRLTPEMKEILDKYSDSEREYLLPIITKTDEDDRRQYRQCQNRVNKGLRKISDLIGGDHKLSAYVARHSWASVARTQGVPVSVISEGLGHENEATTFIYLQSIDSNEVDLANKKVIQALVE